MIDTDKYEGTWKFYGMDYWKHWYKGSCEADTNLIHDAPLLLAEVKRLREAIADIADDMVENLPNNLRVYVSKLRKVIE